MNIKTLMASAALIALCGIASPALAETVTTKTVITQQELANTNQINFIAFDINNDGILTMKEVGEKLFHLFDQDGNGNIDNLEFDRKTVMTIIPMEKETLKLVDYNNDGHIEESIYTHEEFLQRSHLSRFDTSTDGLSAKEFIDTGYEVLDDDEDRLISLDEWREGYQVALHTKVNEPERYN
jgi:Ca2+-binding EF-hand superfamily protein